MDIRLLTYKLKVLLVTQVTVAQPGFFQGKDNIVYARIPFNILSYTYTKNVNYSF